MTIKDIMPSNPLHLGDFVLDSYQRRGLVFKIDHRCAESEGWIKGQQQTVTEAERKERWLSVLCEGGGSVVSPESRLTRIEPFDLNNDWEHYYFRPAKLNDVDSERFTARFSPQAWVRDYAIEVDPEGDTEWDVTAEFATLPSDYRAMLLEEIDRTDDEALDRDDALKGDPNAPEWVREWRGPFDIYVRREDRPTEKESK